MKKLYVILLIACLLAAGCSPSGPNVIKTPTPPRPSGQTDMLGFAADPIPTVRVGFIGIGMRGYGAVERFTNLEGTQIVAICDMEQYNLDRAQKMLAERGVTAPQEYIGSAESWKEMCQRDDIDLIYICTDWVNHTPMAVYAMEHGKHVAIEVPAATTMDECWQLVNTSERTRKHCMMLENCCYDFFELATLNMAQQGLFGEVMHTEGAYIHDLRELNFNDRLSENSSYTPGLGEEKPLPGLSGYYDFWRKRFNETHTGNAYPTHGLGPICQVMNIHRGDRMEYLVSISTDQKGMTEYAEQRFGNDSPEAKTQYKMGDMNTTIIRTAKGRTIMVQHNVSNPRPYSRIHMISGTKGFAQKWPARQLAFDPEAHSAMPRERMDSLLAAYEYPFVTEIKDLAQKVGGHGGMDFIMDYRLVYCLRNGLPLDQDVYDAAEWSCLVELTERSVNNYGAPVEVPDFTRGGWEKIKGFRHAFVK